jgi:hypothetical protein
VKYFDSERGRNYIRSTLRRSKLVEKLVDDWLAAHPEHPPIPHIEDGPADAVDEDQARSVASVGATDPGSILDTIGHPADVHDHDHVHEHDHAHDHAHDHDETDAPASAR